MLKLTVAVVAVVLAGTANAAGWRSLRVDGSSEEAFALSLEVFKDKLSPSRRHAFEAALQDIWTQREQGSRTGVCRSRFVASVCAEQRQYTQEDYYAELDGLSYEQVVRVLDPTGEKAKQYRAQYFYARANEGGGGRALGSPWPTRSPPPVENGQFRGRPQPNQQQ